MCFLNVVHDVKLAHVLEILVHGLHQIVDEFQISHFILFLGVHADDEVQGCVASVDHLVATILDERA